MNITFLLEYCKRLGGHLAEFYTAEEEKAVDDMTPYLTPNYWIGLVDIGNDNSWHWRETNQEPSYTNWTINEPNRNTHACAMKDKNYGWNDYSCTSSSGNYETGYGTIYALCKLFK